MEMDELEQLVRVIVTEDDEDTSKSNFEGLYKNWGKCVNQERREHMLAIQKGHRWKIMDKFRGIVDLVKAVENSNIFQEPKALYRPKVHVAGFTRTAYNNVLTLSEWLTEKPEDFHENWYVVPAPKGTRTLVVASQGTTKIFSKYGHYKGEFYTVLPGGNKVTPGYNNRCCVLDCFYVESTSTMFVLDILAWNSQLMTDGEAEFRHFWLKSHFREIPELQKITEKNELIFTVLPQVSCAPKSFDEFMMTIPYFPNFFPKLDGLLFYHKLAHYYPGKTPLVGWLYPFMVPEVFGSEVTVNPAYMLEKPEDYVSQAAYIEKFEEKSNFNKKKGKKNSNMDTQ